MSFPDDSIVVCMLYIIGIIIYSSPKFGNFLCLQLVNTPLTRDNLNFYMHKCVMCFSCIKHVLHLPNVCSVLSMIVILVLFWQIWTTLVLHCFPGF